MSQNNAGYYCELYDSTSGTPAFGLTSTLDGTTFDRLVTANSAVLAPGDLTVQLANAPITTCTTSWPSTPPTMAAAVPTAIVPSEAQLDVSNIAIRIHWFIDIQSDP